MKKILFITFLISLSGILSSCKKSSTTDTSSGFSNSLQLGTGMNASNFTLTGTGTPFYAGQTIYFRIESSDDMPGSSVKIHIDTNNNGTYIAFKDFTFPNPQNTGHLLISSFTINSPGTFKATGILVNGNKTIGSVNFTEIATKSSEGVKSDPLKISQPMIW